jgi:hypothetical protein
MKEIEKPIALNDALLLGLKVGIFSAIFNVLLFYVFDVLGVVQHGVRVFNGLSVTQPLVALLSLIPSFAAGYLYYVMDNRNPLGFQHFALIVVFVGMASCVLPFFLLTGINIAYGMVLATMHLVVVMSFLFMIKRTRHLK